MSKCKTQRLLKVTEFRKILEIEDHSFKLTNNDLKLQRSSLEGKVVSVDLKTLNMIILCKKCKSEAVLEDGMFNSEK